MKTVYKGLASVGTAIMAVVVFSIVVSFTLGFAEQIWPDNLIARYGAVIFSDLGALIWIGIFIYKAETKTQRLTAFVMFLFDLLIVGMMIAVNTLVSMDVYPQIRQLATVSLAVSAFVNLAALYWFHLHGKETNKEIEFGDITADVEGEALDYLRERKADLSRELAKILGERLLDDALHNFRITRPQIGLPQDFTHRVIDVGSPPPIQNPIPNGNAQTPPADKAEPKTYNSTTPTNPTIAP